MEQQPALQAKRFHFGLVLLCGSMERDSHSTLCREGAGLGMEGCCAAGDPRPTFTRLLPHGLGGSPGTENEPAGVQSPTYSEAPKTSPQGLCCLLVLKIPSLFSFDAARLGPIHSFILCWNRPLSSRKEDSSLFARGYLLCLPAFGPGVFRSRGLPPPPCPASFLGTPSAAPRGPPSPPAAEPAEGASERQPASPARLGSLLPRLCARRGALRSPRVCLPCLVPNNNKVGLGRPHAHTSRQVASFLGSACCSRSCCGHGRLV